MTRPGSVRVSIGDGGLVAIWLKVHRHIQLWVYLEA